MDQRLRLIAELKNNASPEIKRLAKDMNEVRRTQGMDQAEKWFKGFNEATREFGKGGATVGSVLSNIGVGGLTAAASLAGLVKSFSDLAARTTDLKEIGRQTGLTVDQVNQLQLAGQRLHIDPTQMTAGLETLAGKMLDFRRHMGELYGTLNQFDPQFAAKLSLDKPEQQIKDIVEWLGHIQDPQLQKRWTEAFLGDGGLSRLLTHDGRDFANALAEAQQHAAKITPDMQAQAESLYQAVIQFDQSWQNFETSVGPAVFKQLREAVDDFSAAFKEILGDIAALKNMSPTEFLKSLDDGVYASAKHLGDHWRGVFAGTEPLFPGFQSAIPTPFASEAPEAFKPAPGLDQPAPAAAAPPAVQAPPVRDFDANALRRNDEAPVSNPLLHKSAYIEGEDDAPAASGAAGAINDLVRAVATGTKTGFIEAMRELMAQSEVGDGSGASGGFTKASYEEGGVGPQNGYGLRGLSHGGAVGSSAQDLGQLKSLADGPMKGFLDYIGGTEGTDKGRSYDETLAYGKFTGGPVDLQKMTLDQVDALQSKMLANPANQFHSSAAGRYQIVQTTLRRLRDQLHIGGKTLFDKSTQDMLATKLAVDRGPNAAALAQEWSSLKGRSPADILSHYNASGIAAAGGSRSGPSPDGSFTLPGSAPDWMTDRSKRELAGINKELANDLIEASKQTGIHFQIAQGLRTQAEANANARSGAGVSNSQHLYGAAADLHVLDAQGKETYDRGLYERLGKAYEAISAAHGGSGRWLGSLGGRWGNDIVHFDQGLGYGQTHRRDPYGTGGPTADDVKKGNDDAYRSPLNPFMGGSGNRSTLLDEAAKAGLGPQTIRHEGGAAIDIRLEGAGVKAVKTRTSGMINAVNLKRGPTMTEPSVSA